MTSLAEYVSADTADGLLVRAYLAGDEEAFEALYRRYLPDVERYLRAKTNDKTLAEDIAQETLVRALRYLHTYDPARPFWPWLKQIATNLLTTERQRRHGEVLVEEVDRGVLLFPDGSDEVVSREAVISCLNKLPKRQSRALVMRYVEDRDSNDIAALFDLSRNALEQLILRGKTGFRKEYRAQNGLPLLPGFAALAARVRRILTAFSPRSSGATSAAGDIAIGAALTVSAVGIAVAVSISPSGPPIPWAAGVPGEGAAPVLVTPGSGSDVDGRDLAANDRASRAAVTTAEATSYAAGAVPGEAQAATGDDTSAAPGAPGAPVAPGVPGTTKPVDPGDIDDEVDDQAPNIQAEPPAHRPSRDVELEDGARVGGVVGAGFETETHTEPEDGSHSTTTVEWMLLGDEQSVSTMTNLGDGCLPPGCL